MGQITREQSSIPRNDHCSFFSVSPFGVWTSSLRRLWLKRRIRAPGTRATHAMASSCSRRSHETKSSSDDTSDSMTPVWTQMKLYGRRPTEAEEDECGLNTCLLLTKGPFLLHSPIKTEQKKNVMGMLTMGADMLRNQLGVMGKNLRNSRKKNKQSWLSSTWTI